METLNINLAFKCKQVFFNVDVLPEKLLLFFYRGQYGGRGGLQHGKITGLKLFTPPPPPPPPHTLKTGVKLFSPPPPFPFKEWKLFVLSLYF